MNMYMLCDVSITCWQVAWHSYIIKRSSTTKRRRSITVVVWTMLSIKPLKGKLYVYSTLYAFIVTVKMFNSAQS